jgi:nucleoside-diphosphate-sugar epimerase
LRASGRRDKGSIVRILLLGGTGTIGGAIRHGLLRESHRIVALARSKDSAETLGGSGIEVIHGDIGLPERWVPKLPPVDAVIHAACDFASDMERTEQRLLNALLPKLAAQGRKARFLYTGGNWLFGATGNRVADETSDFAPLPAFAWMVPNSRRILQSHDVDGIVIHPAMVYSPNAGAFWRFAREAVEREAIRVVESESVRWPLVHRDDLAALYLLALHRAPPQSSYCGAAIESLPVGRIARAFARRFGTKNPEPEVVSADAVAREYGEWARGYALDQQMSGDKARRELDWAPLHLDPEREIESSSTAR